MNPRILAVPVLAAAIAACLWFFLGTAGYVSVGTLTVPAESGGAMRTVETGGKTASSENSTAAVGKKPAVNWKRLGAPGDAGEVFPPVTSADIASFHAKHGETAVNLVAAFEKTHDRRWIERALELFPNSPVVLMTAVDSIPSVSPKPGEPYQPDAQRMAYIERFKAADANNPLPWIFSAQEFFKAKQTADALADVRAALDRPAFYTYANERVDSVQLLYENLGLHPIEAGVLATVGQPLPHLNAAMQSSRSLMEWQKSAGESGDTAGAEDAIQLAYGLGRMFATPEASRLLIGQLVGVSMEKRALAALPPDAQRDYLPVTPAQRIADLEKQQQAVKDLVGTADWLSQSQNEPHLVEYFRRLRSDGEFSALTWLRTQKK